MRFSGRIILFLSALLLLGAGSVFCFDNVKTHPDLSEVAAQIHNQSATRQLTDEQISWIAEGSINEDADPRYLNHYYDPTTGLGLSDNIWKGMAAKDWAKKQDSLTGDYSESAILNNYRQGNLKRSFQGIGHIIHLIQDMGVPAHTRNDAHPEGDPFEEWARDYGKVNNNFQEIQINNLDQAFDELALYSHNNFFSKDTIKILQDNKYQKVNQNIGGKVRTYLVNRIDNKDYKIVYTQNPDSLFSVYQVDGDYGLNFDYWNLLYPKAVGYSAGTIDYFIKEFEKIDQKNKEKEQLSYWERMKVALAFWEEDAKYAWGDAFMASRLAAGKVWNSLFNNDNQDSLTDENNSKQNNGIVLSDKIVTDNATSEEEPEEAEEKVGVARVIDGDTIVLTTGEYVRYIGVNTPELNEPGAQDDECLAWVARIRNMKLLSSGKFRLVKDKSADKDKYGRLLRYVYSGNIFLNEQLALEGLGREFFCQPGWKNCPVTTDEARAKLIKTAAASAQENKRGLYSGVCAGAKTSAASTIVASSTGEVLGEEITNPDQTTEENDNDNLAATSSDDFVYVSGTGSGSASGGNAENSEPTDDDGKQVAINSFNLFDLNSGNIYYTASATVGVDLEIEDEVQGYYFSTSSSTPEINDPAWQSDVPLNFVLNSGDGLKKIFVWLKKAGQIVGAAQSVIYLDTQAPQLSFGEKPDNFSNATTSIFTILSNEDKIGLRYKFDNDDWRLIATNTPFFNESPWEEGTHTLQAEAIDFAGNLASTSYEWLVDLTSPTANMDDLNYKYETMDFPVSWQGEDEDKENVNNQIVSGLKDYDAQYRINDNDWQDWLSGTASTTKNFDQAVADGDEVYFRVRARDQAENVSEWSDSAQTGIDLVIPPLHRWYINEGEGTVLHDVVGDDDLTVASSTWSEGNFLKLGAGEKIEKDFTEEIPENNLSVIFWFRYPVSNEPFKLSLKNSEGNNTLGISLGLNGFSILVNEENISFDDSKFNGGDWHLLAFTYNSETSEIILYIDYNKILDEEAGKIISPINS
ncbi:MAG: thermonuclease family protein, partial [Patescibacteria group bacterium]|nr:thermonuclease family protein [Patescibacteria group bacterium]